jgi:hypothetical protein
MRPSLVTFMAAVGLVAFAGMAPLAAAQAPSPGASGSSADAGASDTKRTPEVIISADRAEFTRKISLFVDHITEFDAGDPSRGMARWESPACPLVTGLNRDQGEYILWRLSDIARTIGAPLGGQHCKPNIFIIITKKPEAYLREQEKHHATSVFNGAATTLIDEFIAAPQPIRTWYNTAEETPEGLPMVSMSFPGVSQQNTVPSGNADDEGVNIPVAGNVNGGVVTNPWAQASHLVMNAVMAIKHVLVVVDPSRFQNVSIGQLADYVSMAGLAQIKLDKHQSDDQSILAMFDTAPGSRPPALTSWDEAFLKAVYSSEQKSVLQRSLIARQMVRTMAPTP